MGATTMPCPPTLHAPHTHYYVDEQRGYRSAALPCPPTLHAPHTHPHVHTHTHRRMAPSRKPPSSSSSPAAAWGNTTLDETGVPNEAVLQAIEALGFTCAVHDVTAQCGLPKDLVEAEMAALLRASNGFFEVPSASANDNPAAPGSKEVEYQANVWSTDHVKYVYPPGLRALLRRRFVLMRLREGLASVALVGFKVLRVSFGLLLLLSLLIVVLVIIVVLARSGGGGDHRHGHGHGLEAFRILHRPRRHYVGGGGNDGFWFWYFWFNYNPFFFGLDPQQQRWREQQARRRRILNDLDDEEAGAPRGGGTRRRAASSSSNRLARIQAEGGGPEEYEQEEEEMEVEEDMTFLEAVFSLLFGDGSPGPSENHRWMHVAKLIHSQGGIVLPEEVVPLLTHVDPHRLDQSMLPVCARFGGKPVRCVDGKSGKDFGYLYDFATMREGGRPSTLLAPTSSTSYSDGREEATAALLATSSSSSSSMPGSVGEIVLEMREMNDDKEEAEEEGGEVVEDEDDDVVLGMSSSLSSSCGGNGGYLEERRYVFSRAPTQML